MGKLFRAEKLETLTHFALSLYQLKPIDAIYWSFQEDTICFGGVVPQLGGIHFLKLACMLYQADVNGDMLVIMDNLGKMLIRWHLNNGQLLNKVTKNIYVGI